MAKTIIIFRGAFKSRGKKAYSSMIYYHYQEIITGESSKEPLSLFITWNVPILNLYRRHNYTKYRKGVPLLLSVQADKREFLIEA